MESLAGGAHLLGLVRAPPLGVGGSSNSKDSSQTADAAEGGPLRRKPGRPPKEKRCQVCGLLLAAAGLKGYYLVRRLLCTTR